MTCEAMHVVLAKRMKVIFDKIPANKWSYFHKRSFENFIYYLPQMPDDVQPVQIEKIISSYLDDIDSDLHEIDMDLSEYLFKTYLNKLIQPYESTLDFVPVFGKKAYLVLFPICALMFYISMDNAYVITGFCTIAILYIVRIVHKATKRKIYGFGY